ncbi:hypothetical protein pdam_00023569 [Pocillopora damicornis]|uniref:Uncharacterized protein n=1 Tax=Pocillopora damicornis TaxID=46731 RepID=A0A3M6V6F3_POCDA|nr:hypothetical protein pdam_00023569 [Pocillopora damicornis]
MFLLFSDKGGNDLGDHIDYAPGSFHGKAAVDHDFIRVEVVTSSGATKSDVHMHVFPKREVLKREQKPGGIPLNVALVMFDSTSTANFKRKLPKSWKHLTTNLNSIVMRDDCVGLHKRLRGDNIDDYAAITKLSTLEVVLVVDMN